MAGRGGISGLMVVATDNILLLPASRLQAPSDPTGLIAGGVGELDFSRICN